jgi:alpha-glucoside transport system permease protein
MEIKSDPPPASRAVELFAWIGRLGVSLLVPLVTFLVMWRVFLFLRDQSAPRLVVALVAIIWGVGGVATLFVVSNWLVERMGRTWQTRLQPFVFVGPALAILTWYLFLPTLRTLYYSFYDRSSTAFVGFANYIFAFTDKAMLESFRNNLVWLIFATSLSVMFGLLIAMLADRSRFEKLAKIFIFMPMAISFVGAGVIWRFIYYYKPPGEEQIGLLNGIVTAMGGQPQAWLTLEPWNTFFLIAIMVWLQTGFAMVILSAALKGVPEELLEAARLDGATEIQAFFRIIIPYIRGTIITVATTILIATLKIFDIVFVMTNGLFGTEVMASQQYKQMFKFQDFGRGSAVAIVLLVAVIPVMIYNLRQFSEREAFS